jgi:hypothetical protein
MSLACGGRGPCCHIGYSHRHCEHCDVVIPTYHAHYWQPPSYWQTPYYYGTSGLYSGGMQSSLANQFQQLTSSTTVVEGTSHSHEEAN